MINPWLAKAKSISYIDDNTIIVELDHGWKFKVWYNGIVNNGILERPKVYYNSTLEDCFETIEKIGEIIFNHRIEKVWADQCC